MSKLYVVTLTLEEVVLADSEEEALDMWHTILKGTEGIPDLQVAVMTKIPEGWDDLCLPWGGNDHNIRYHRSHKDD